jgi:microcystin-dependent protein
LAEVIDTLYPVGALYTSTLSTNPATLLGRGTWSAFGAGRVLVGRDGNDTDFDTAEETGGAKTVTLTEAQIPSHTHVQNSHNHTQDAHLHAQQRFPTATGASTGFTVDTSMSGTPAAANNTGSTTATNQAATATNQNTGGGGAHNNLQPYIVVYMWKRTA